MRGGREGGKEVVGTCIFEKGGRNIEWGEWREGGERKKEGFPDDRGRERNLNFLLPVTIFGVLSLSLLLLFLLSRF